jgi:hypothetical protein
MRTATVPVLHAPAPVPVSAIRPIAGLISIRRSIIAIDSEVRPG